MRIPVVCLSFVVLLVLQAPAVAADAGVRYFGVVNRAHERLMSLSAAPAGSEAYVDVALGTPVPGGGHAVTVELRVEDCRQDLLLVFRNGQRVQYPGVDVCAHRGLTILPAHARRMPSQELATREPALRADE